MKSKIINSKLSISSRKIAKFLLFFVLGLSLLSVMSNAARNFLPDYPFRDILYDILSVDNEASIPAFYSAYGLQFCALLLAVIAYLTKVGREEYLRHWQALALIFAYHSFMKRWLFMKE